MAKRNRRVPRYLRESLGWQADGAGHQIEIPRDAIRANPSLQALNDPYASRPYYRDYEFTCCDCGIPQVWTAEQQRWWYEVARGPIYSRAKRCRACRAALRATHGGTPRRSQAERNREAER